MLIGNERESFKLFDYQFRVDKTFDRLSRQAFVKRLWEQDVTIWRQPEESDSIRDDERISKRLGWINVVDTMKPRVDEIVSFAEEVKAAGFEYAVLMGMGGSSLSPEVSSLTFGSKEGYPKLFVLDSTVPAAVSEIEGKIDLEKTLFIVSTKSGTTAETLSAYAYFYGKLKKANPGENFISITDPGSKLIAESEAKGFRKTFINFSDIGGRFSALSYFGLVPAAIIGADIKLLLDRASEMMALCSPETQITKNPGVSLGVALAELAMQGKDKMTMIMSPEIASFGSWVEQLVAESTGKNGVGIVPVDLEPLADPHSYGDDRVFVYIRLKNSSNADLDMKVSNLIEAVQPTIIINLEDTYDLGGEYFRWEMATGVACALMGVNAFNQPNVEESKKYTLGILAEVKEGKEISSGTPIAEEGGIQLFCDANTKKALDELMAVAHNTDNSLKAHVKAFLRLYQPGNYFALMAFIKGTSEVDEALQSMRSEIIDTYSAATTLGYGPRFLHSTGQLHKGGANNGLFIQFTADDPIDVPIPGQPYTFSVLKNAQAQGDALALKSKGRPFIQIHLGSDAAGNLKRVLSMF